MVSFSRIILSVVVKYAFDVLFVFKQNADDRSRLFALSENGEAAMLDVFLERQGPAFNVNLRNDEGETALHVAARHGKAQSCKILLRRGAELVPDAHGKTAYDLAFLNGHTFCASMLRAKIDAGSLSSRSSAPVSSNSSNPQPANYASVSQINAFAPQSGSLQEPPLQDGQEAIETRRTGFVDDLPRPDAPRESSRSLAKTMTVRALYNYKAADEIPFPPDERPEFSLFKGEQLEIVHMREDGWCIVRRSGSVQNLEYCAYNNVSLMFLPILTIQPAVILSCSLLKALRPLRVRCREWLVATRRKPMPSCDVGILDSLVSLTILMPVPVMRGLLPETT